MGGAPARFLLLFVSLESLFEPAPRSEEARNHVQSLIDATQQSPLEQKEKEAIGSILGSLKKRSINQTGRDLASRLLGEHKYDELEAEAFFSKIYKMRNKIVHEGEIDPAAIHSIVGEMDRFVSDLIRRHCVEISGTDRS